MKGLKDSKAFSGIRTFVITFEIEARFWELLATIFISKFLGEVFVKIEIVPMVSEPRSRLSS